MTELITATLLLVQQLKKAAQEDSLDAQTYTDFKDVNKEVADILIQKLGEITNLDALIVALVNIIEKDIKSTFIQTLIKPDIDIILLSLGKTTELTNALLPKGTEDEIDDHQEINEKINKVLEAEELLKAVSEALNNIKNCSKRGFTDTSIANFKNTYKKHGDVITKNLINTQHATEWLIAISNYASTEPTLTEKARQAFNEVSKKTELPEEIVDQWIVEFKDVADEDTLPPLEILNKSEIVRKNELANIIPTNDSIFISTMAQMAHSMQISQPLRIDSLKNSTQNVRTWFEDFERHTIQWNKNDKGFKVPTYFDDVAVRKWRLMVEKDKYNYEAIKKYMISKLQSRDDDTVYCTRAQFYTIKQEINETVEDFQYRLCQCKQDWPQHEHITFENDKSRVFLKGLQAEIRLQMATVSTTHFNELIKIAKQVEQSIKQRQELNTLEASIAAPITTEIKRDTNQIKCYLCHKDGHIARNCNLKQQRNKTPKMDCFICGKNTHYPVNCDSELRQLLNKTQTESTKPINSFNVTNRTKSKYCSSCKQTTHNTEECRYRSMTCNKCKKIGHHEKYCRTNLNE